MKYDDLKILKKSELVYMRELSGMFRERLAKIDGRMVEYMDDLLREDEDVHNLDEILCFRKFLRLLNTYEFDYQEVRSVIYDAEGEWQDGRHIDGGLKIDGIYGTTHYRLTPMQVYTFAWIYGFKHWVDTGSPNGSREPLPSERMGENGTIEDLRRLTSFFVLFWPRKLAKTFTSAFIQFEGLMNGEADYEGYIVANSSAQSELLFKQLKNMVTQMDGYNRYFRITNSPQDRTIAWKRYKRSFVKALTSAPSTKDGLKASVCSPDEFGGSQRKGGKLSDMENVINAVEGSMGPRREPLTVHTSTAGLGVETPYEEVINRMHEDLLRETYIELDEPCEQPNDWQGGIMLRPDLWEMDDDELLKTDRIIRKVNPNLGITVQKSFYEKEWRQAEQQGDGKRREVITKLYNIFASDRAEQWISADVVRRLQVDRRIDDCTEEEGWRVYVGMDFSLGNDLNASTYLAVRDTENGMEFFSDMDAWMAEDAMKSSTAYVLYGKYVERGHLQLCPGAVVDPDAPVNRIAELYEKGVRFCGFGYDAYKSSFPIARLKEWLFAELGEVNPAIVDLVKPVSQTAGAFNPLVMKLDYIVKRDEPSIRFSKNAMWPYEFQNSVLITDGYGNRKVYKARPQEKIDNVVALCDALAVFDFTEMRVMQVSEE